MNTRHWLATVVTGAVAALGLVTDSAVAATPVHPQSGLHTLTTGDYGVVIGPLIAKHGFKAEIEAVDCGKKDGGVFVSFEKGNDTVALDHSYARAGGTCAVSKTLDTATLKVRWGTALTLNLKIATTTTLRRVASGICKNSHFEYRTAQTTGTGVVRIHPKAFGALRLKRDAVRVLALVTAGTCTAAGTGSGTGTSGPVMPIDHGSGGFSQAARHSALGRAAWAAMSRAASLRQPAAQIRQPADPTTTTTTATTPTAPTTTTTPATPTTTTAPTTTPPPTVTPDRGGTQFLGVFDDNEKLVITAATESRYKPLVIINDDATDAPAAGVVGTMDVAIQSAQAFTVAAGDAGAQVSAAAAFARGTLVFTPTGLCHASTDALDGTLAGSIVVTDPVFGTLTYNGPTAVGSALGDGDANLASC